MSRATRALLLAACVLGACRARSEPRNVVVVVWDTARADRMSLYGHDRPTTPRLDALAAEAVVFDRAIAPAPWTVPSHAAMFTGLPSASTGAGARWMWLDGRHLTLAEHFSAQGYDTWAFTANPYLSAHTNLLQGFGAVHSAWHGDLLEPSAKATAGKLIAEDRSTEISPAWVPTDTGRGYPDHLTATKDAAPVGIDALLAWLDRREPDTPFLAFLNLLEAHHPRVPSRGARSLLEPELAERALQTDASLFRQMAAMEGRRHFEPDELEALRGVYDAALLDLDRETGRLVDGLRSRELLDDTVFVVLSDHGESLGEHGMFEHRWSVHEELLHVPFVVRAPGLEPARVVAPVSTGDLFGTLVALSGVQAPGVAHPLPSALEPRLDVFSELMAPTPRLPEVRHAFPDLSARRWRRRFRVAYRGSTKLVRASDGQHAMYDLASDPGELRDVSEEHPDLRRALEVVLRSWVAERPLYNPAHRDPSDRPGDALGADREAIRQQLEMLGYVDE